MADAILELDQGAVHGAARNDTEPLAMTIWQVAAPAPDTVKQRAWTLADGTAIMIASS